MDDLNALAEALVAALNEGDAERATRIRASMDRFALALGWNPEGTLLAIHAYANKTRRAADDLFGPAFILKRIAPEHPETARLLARISSDCRALLDRLAARG